MLLMREYMRAGALRRTIAAFAVLVTAGLSLGQDAPEAQPVRLVASDQGSTPSATASSSGSTDVNGNKTVSVVQVGAPLDRIIGKLNEQGVKVSAKGKTSAVKIPNYIVRSLPVKDALSQLINTQPNWNLYEPPDQPGTYEIWDADSFRAEVLPKLVRPKTFVLRNITAEDALKAITSVITPNIGTAAAEPRSNKLFVTDLVPVLERIQTLLDQIDVEFITRVFYIKHADIQQISEKLANLKSPAAPAPEVDERTRLIIVRDRLDILRQMELVVETLDIGPELRVYDLNNVGVDGEDLEELEDAINEVITEGALFKINSKQSRMILRDVPEVHDQVEKILSAFDRPLRQVLIEAEIIETQFNQGFEYGIDYTFGRNLEQLVLNGLVDIDGPGNTANTLGFQNFRKAFPFAVGGSTGLTAQALSNHAFVALKASMSDSRSRVLQQPRILVQNQETASFVVGQQIPYFTGGSIGVTNTGNNQTLTPSSPVQQFLDVGLSLEITPVIANNGLIKMEIVITNDTAQAQQDIQFNGQQFSAIGKNNQELDTVLAIPSGETRVIGGLVSDKKGDSRGGIPILYKIPVIGPALFGSYTASPDNNFRNNLLIFLTPTIVQDEPGDLLKYKGRLLADSDSEVPTTPSATLSDYDLEHELPLPPDKTAYLETPLDYGTPTLAPPVDIPSAAPVSELAPLNSQPVSETFSDSAKSSSGMQPLKKIRIKDSMISEDEARIRAMLPKSAGPSGMLSSTTGGTASAPAGVVPGQPQPGQPLTTGQPPQPGQPQPPPVVAPPVAPVTISQPPVAATPGIFQPPPTETKVR